MVSYQMHVYSLDEWCQLHMQFLAEMTSLYFLPGTRNLQIHARACDNVVYFDFKKSSYRFVSVYPPFLHLQLHIHLPGTLGSCLCLSAYCYTCKEQVD